MVVPMGGMMTIRGGAAVLIGAPVEVCSRRIKSSDAQQDFVGHFAVTGFADAKAVEMVIQPSPDLLALPRGGKGHLVQDQPVREADLFPQPAPKATRGGRLASVCQVFSAPGN
jgi:hypothetical protein